MISDAMAEEDAKKAEASARDEAVQEASDLEAAKIAENNRTHPATEMGLRGDKAFEFKNIIAVRGTGKKKQYMLEWVENYVGEHGDNRYTWEPKTHVPKVDRNRFDAAYVPVEKGVRSIVSMHVACYHA